MNQNDSAGVMSHGSLNDLSGVNAGAINAAVKEDLERQHPVLGVEKHHTENFMFLLHKVQF
ncbi:hypothetical protein D3C80_2074890 [compost metagenome]